MKTSTTFVSVAILFALISFALGRIIWPDVPDMSMTMPSSTQLPFFIALGALESIAFGVGIAFALFGWKHVRRVMPDNKRGAVLSFIALIWMLVSWWPHDNMHRTNPMGDIAGLLRIEYIFHFTLIIATFILVYYFWNIISHTNTADM